MILNATFARAVVMIGTVEMIGCSQVPLINGRKDLLGPNQAVINSGVDGSI